MSGTDARGRPGLSVYPPQRTPAPDRQIVTLTERAVLLPTLAAGFIAGLLLGERWSLSIGSLSLLTLAGLLLIVLSLSLRRSVLPAVVLTAALLGLLRSATVETPGAELAPYHEVSGVHVRGIVTNDPTVSGSVSSFTLSVDSLSESGASWSAVRGDIMVTAAPTSDIARSRDSPLIRYGDRLKLRGSLEAPERLDDFDFPAYLERQGIGTVMSFPDIVLISEGGGTHARRLLITARRSLGRAISESVAEPQAAFGRTILLGIRDDLPDSLTEDFRRSGAAHLLAISGLHVGILLVGTTSASALLFGRRRQLYLLVPLATVWLYVLVSGASPSAARAAVMGTLLIAAMGVGRPRNLLPSLALAASVLAAIDPRVLSSISFQLSFAAMMGIGVYLERLDRPMQRLVRVDPYDGGLVAGSIRAMTTTAGVTIAATVATAPLVGLHFGQIPTAGLVTTLLTLPALPLALCFHGATALVGLASETVATPVGWLAWGFSSYITTVVHLLARVPTASVELGESATRLLWVFYGALAAAVLLVTNYLAWRPRIFRGFHPLRAAGEWTLPWQVIAIALTFSILIWTAALSRHDGVLRVVFADVEQGEMTVISTPHGHRIVVDGGPDGSRAAHVVGTETRFWERDLDLVVLTHPHSDHVTGLNEILRRYRVARVMERRQEFDSSEYVEWSELVEAEGAEMLESLPGMRLSFDDGVILEVLGPPSPMLVGTESDVDNGSVVLRIVYADISFLLTADIFSEGEAWLVRSELPLVSDVLNVAHHGSQTSSTERFIGAVSPAAAVISVGGDNPFGHPDPAVVKRLEEYVGRSQVFRTSDHGSVAFETDGKSLWVNTERSN